ncbi:MAG: DUF4430 domain-containing protein [Burkholderiales bacterium]|jgi:hypothetical protein|nr:DUF4430 domain-containing protein [Burkholderiales bacterium]
MSNASTVQVAVTGGPSISVPWFQGMNAQQALEGAYNQLGNSGQFSYAIQYYGTGLGYLVAMINETYDSVVLSAAPFFYWQFLVNGLPSQSGIDGVTLNPGDKIAFSFEMYEPVKHARSTLAGKHARQVRASVADAVDEAAETTS